MFGNLKIGLRLGIGFAIVTAALIIVALISINSLEKLNQETNDLAYDKYPKTVWSNDIIDAINEAARALRNAFITIDEKRK